MFLSQGLLLWRIKIVVILLRLRDLCLDSLFDLIVIGTKYLRLSSDSWVFCSRFDPLFVSSLWIYGVSLALICLFTSCLRRLR